MGIILPRGYVLNEFRGTAIGGSMKPAIAVNPQCLAGIVLEFGGLLDGFEERVEA